MKNKIIKSLFTLAIALIAIPSVYAEYETIGGSTGTNMNGSGEQDIQVEVGTVDTPIYSVNLEWTSMSFDYRYNEETYSYNWVPQDNCYQLVGTESGSLSTIKQNAEALYDDSACSIDYTGNPELEIEGEVVYAKNYGGIIKITDNSVYGHVTPAFTWTSEAEYDIIPFLYYTSLNPPTDSVYDVSVPWFQENGYTYIALGQPTSTLEIPLSSYQKYDDLYRIKLVLENSPTAGEINPSAGDVIGQLTVILRTNK